MYVSKGKSVLELGMGPGKDLNFLKKYYKATGSDSSQVFLDQYMKKYKNVKGLCRVATIEEIKKAGYSLNPGRYVGVADNGGDDGDFEERIRNLHNEFRNLTSEAHKSEKKIFDNLKKVL